MDYEMFDRRNPYFIHDANKVCAVCTRKLPKSNFHSLNKEILPNSSTKVYEVIQSISKFKLHEDGPQFLCDNCLTNTFSAYKLQIWCNRSQEYFEKYMKHREHLLEEENKKYIENNLVTKVEEIHIEITDADTLQEVEQAKPINNIRVKSNVKRAQCKVCLQMYRADNITVHMRTHTGEKPYKCKYCNAAFSQWSSLRYHTESHENKREHVCGYCGARFNSSARLVIHERSHTGERPFACKDCTLTFVTREGLRRHSVVHTKEKPYTCDYCAKSYNRKSTLRVHVKIHTGEKPHVCHICAKAFIQRQSLKSHLQTHTTKRLPLGDSQTKAAIPDETHCKSEDALCPLAIAEEIVDNTLEELHPGQGKERLIVDVVEYNIESFHSSQV